ncbi:spermine synthase [Nadsonia fulvescens var. elongata DSM 6958]|uniref:Spermine synthase n=1 Tax=Nadsonia fulvescens var. elongata DSM 6958 TaxID=857566 RepID=A0A1E3PJN9_9ASCO|nr:spermine synthase [Nadsonia fulvescens var. elongata DSM 6958]
MVESPQNLSHPTIKDSWFSEISDHAFPGQGFMIRVAEILYVGKSMFQDVLVFKSTDYGNVLVLDGIIQVTERDEFAYQEMICHLAMNSHENPQNILVIGGGDGGVLREVVKHDSVKEVTLCEIDQSVIDVSKKYLPEMARGFDHPKVKLNIGDGFEYLKNSTNKFDVIITDSSDPEGPAEAFFQENYFKLLHNALTENGVIITQASESVWLNFRFIKRLKNICEKVFPQVEYAYTMVPTYTSGQLGLMICTKRSDWDIKKPLRAWPEKVEATINRYYNRQIHESSFILPNWAKHYLRETDNQN